MIKGTKIELNGTEYVCPPLCLDDVQEYLPRIQAMQAEGDKGGFKVEHIALVKEVVFAALKRNYPDLDQADVGKGLDLGNFKEVMDAVLARTGLKRVPMGEAPAAAS